MKQKSYPRIPILIVTTAVILIAAQVYFTLQNYRVNQQRFINDVQIALDLSVEKYFSDQALTNLKVFTLNIPDKDTTLLNRQIKATVSASARIESDDFFLDSSEEGFRYKWAKVGIADSVWHDSSLQMHNSQTLTKISVMKGGDSLVEDLQQLTSKVMLSFSEDLLDLGKMLGMVEEELERKNLSINFALRQMSDDRTTKIGTIEEPFLSTTSKSSYLGSTRVIHMDFENATLSILRRGMVDILLSVLLVGLVLGTMLHLNRTIHRQKQLAEIKDDLISNITHEFKTPIATIFTALEGVTNFNAANDPQKTKKYLSISNDQLKKLNAMVEKLLETATIDKGKLQLNREEVELVNWTQEVVDGFAMVAGDKNLSTDLQVETNIGSIDIFHFENTLANLIDNAIKYGGSDIQVRLLKEGEQLVWEVEDNGGGIPKDAQQRIFDKLYRVPKGNTHDVKGFGIGLYYAKTIAELHEGTLELKADKNRTIF